MISFENYPKGGNNRTLLYIIVGIVGAFALYKLYEWYTLVPAVKLRPGDFPGDTGDKMKHKDVGDGYGYDDNDWNYIHSAQVGVDGVDGRDPSNDVQKYTSRVSPIDGKTYYDPVTMQTPQDYLTEDEFDFIVDRHTLGYNKCQLDWLTTPSYIRNGDMWFGMPWPNDDGAPLSNTRGACVQESDIIHHGIFRSNGKFGDHPACKSNSCVY